MFLFLFPCSRKHCPPRVPFVFLDHDSRQKKIPAKKCVMKERKQKSVQMCKIDIAYIMKEDFIEKDEDCSKYEWLPTMGIWSKGSIGSILASSFCKCINSCTDQAVKKLLRSQGML
jgi:hypothetical protein